MRRHERGVTALRIFSSPCSSQWSGLPHSSDSLTTSSLCDHVKENWLYQHDYWYHCRRCLSRSSPNNWPWILEKDGKHIPALGPVLSPVIPWCQCHTLLFGQWHGNAWTERSGFACAFMCAALFGSSSRTARILVYCQAKSMHFLDVGRGKVSSSNQRCCLDWPGVTPTKIQANGMGWATPTIKSENSSYILATST